MRVLAYPKFRLNALDLEQLFADLLPWCETWTDPIICAEQHDQLNPVQVLTPAAFHGVVHR